MDVYALSIYKVQYDYTDEAFMLVEADTPEEAVERLGRQLSGADIKFTVKGITILNEGPVSQATLAQKEKMN